LDECDFDEFFDEDFFELFFELFFPGYGRAETAMVSVAKRMNFML
jgi:hypothetical protein